MSSKEQMSFDFVDESNNQTKSDKVSPKQLQRAVLGWLVPQKPTGVGVNVPTRFSRFQADIAAFWSKPRRKHLVPGKTMIVEIRRNRQQCWPHCANHNELLPELKKLKSIKNSLEADIRRNEPELKDTDNLFDEFETWRYEESKNQEYHKCRRDIEIVEQALYQGSRFERIRQSHLADLLYLAVPENSVHPHEIADGWGLLFISGFNVKVVKEAENWNCPEENKFHFIQQIAASDKKHLLFAHGIRADRESKPIFTPVPHRRRKSG